jgi:regulator of PEP synthase PpsR (kinase-PPPase family)
MGEFAKSKIDDVINYLHEKESKIKSDDEAQKLIHIIGEPIVKNQLQRMLDSRRLSKIDIVNQKIKDMSYELEILKQHQAKIVQNELRDRGKKKYKQSLEDD